MVASSPLVLCVDDQSDNRSAIALTLQLHGIQVIEASTAAEALRRARDNPDVILLDVGLPDLDGFEVCRRLKADPLTASIPVLQISGIFPSSADRARGLEGGADAYLPKPVDARELIAQVNALLRIRRAEDSLRARARQQAAVAQFSQHALALPMVSSLVDVIPPVVTRTLDVPMAAVWEYRDDGSLLLRAGIGWKEAVLGHPVTSNGSSAHAGSVLCGSTPIVIEDLATETRYVVSLLGDHGVVSGAGVPIPGREGPYGVLGAYTRQARCFNEDDIHFLQGLANVLAAALERKRAEKQIQANDEELRLARAIQRKLFPSDPPRLIGLEIAGAAYPAHATGGDYYDFITLADGSVAVVIGDVSGHGLGPAMLMAEARAYLRAFARTHNDPSEILTLTNCVLAEDIEEDRFVTLFLAKIDPRARRLVYASAGHLAGYVLGPAGAVKRVLSSTGPPLGIVTDVDFPAGAELTLSSGDLVVLLTDGIVDSRSPDGALFEAGRALDTARLYRHDPPQRIVENLYHAARGFAYHEPQQDDITAVVIKAVGC